jgi:hypothetical protein
MRIRVGLDTLKEFLADLKHMAKEFFAKKGEFCNQK